MKISIALATYNGELYLKEQLDSFLLQTSLPDEIVISDDNSIDDTFNILLEFKKKAPFNVLLLKNQGEGYNKNFENALKNTSGDIVFVSDQDDVWFSNKIETMLKHFESNPESMLAIHDLQYCDSQLKLINQTKLDRIKGFNNTVRGYVTGMASAIKEEFLQTCLPVPENMNYDSWIHACANILGIKSICIDTLALYRRHEDNATESSLLNVHYRTRFYHFFLKKIQSSQKKGVEKNIIKVQNLIEYINKNRYGLKFGMYDLHNIENGLKKELTILNYRKNLLDKNILKRIPLALSLYFKKGYSNYSGWKSMVNDIVNFGNNENP